MNGKGGLELNQEISFGSIEKKFCENMRSCMGSDEFFMLAKSLIIANHGWNRNNNLLSIISSQIAVPVPITMINNNPSLLQTQSGLLVSVDFSSTSTFNLFYNTQTHAHREYFIF